MQVEITGECWTRLGEFADYSWPRVFAAVPRRGERIQAFGHPDVTLEVVQVTHFARCSVLTGKQEPEIRVELYR